MSWYGLILAGLAVVFLLSVAFSLFVVGARSEDDEQEDTPPNEDRKTEDAGEPALPRRKKTLH